MATNNEPKGFTLLLHGELWFTRDRYTAWQLPSMLPVVGITLEDAVRDPKAFDEAALIIGREVMARGVRYAARGARRWARDRAELAKTLKAAPPMSAAKRKAMATLGKLPRKSSST